MTNLANSIARLNRCSLNVTPIKILSSFVPNTLLATVHVWCSPTPKGMMLYLTHSPLCIFALFWLSNCKIRVHIRIKSCKQGRICQLYNVLVYCLTRALPDSITLCGEQQMLCPYTTPQPTCTLLRRYSQSNWSKAIIQLHNKHPNAATTTRIHCPIANIPTTSRCTRLHWHLST